MARRGAAGWNVVAEQPACTTALCNCCKARTYNQRLRASHKPDHPAARASPRADFSPADRLHCAPGAAPDVQTAARRPPPSRPSCHPLPLPEPPPQPWPRAGARACWPLRACWPACQEQPPRTAASHNSLPQQQPPRIAPTMSSARPTSRPCEPRLRLGKQARRQCVTARTRHLNTLSFAPLALSQGVLQRQRAARHLHGVRHRAVAQNSPDPALDGECVALSGRRQRRQLRCNSEQHPARSGPSDACRPVADRQFPLAAAPRPAQAPMPPCRASPTSLPACPSRT